jgi:regulator of RNase E activity RraA
MPHANNLQWVGVEQTMPGDVTVIDSRRDESAASMGNMPVTRILKRGVRGVRA